MIHRNDSKAQPISLSSLGKRMAIGASIALLLITLFLISADESNPAWGKFWMIRPLIIVPLAGAIGSLFFYLFRNLGSQGGWKKFIAFLISLLGYLVALWLGIVLGLDGTLWD